MAFKKTLELARKASFLKKEEDQVIDSTPMLGAAPTKDTYELLRDGIRKILSSLDKKTKSKMNLSLKAYSKGDTKPKINWDNKKEREELLASLISDVKEVLFHVDTSKEDVDNELKDAVNLLAKILSQDDLPPLIDFLRYVKSSSPRLKYWHRAY